jgi:hypothetical protein
MRQDLEESTHAGFLYQLVGGKKGVHALLSKAILILQALPGTAASGLQPVFQE